MMMSFAVYFLVFSASNTSEGSLRSKSFRGSEISCGLDCMKPSKNGRCLTGGKI
jgi:hypothetical protein